MKLYLKASIVTLVLGLLIGVVFWKWEQTTVEVGGGQRIESISSWEKNGVPPFSGKLLDGNEFVLASMQGRPFILSFWASWCGPCVEEFPSMISLVEKLGGKVDLVAVSQDSSKEDIEAFLKAFPGARNPHIHIVWDESHEIGNLYNADRLPESYVIGSELKLVKRVVGSINWATVEAVQFMENLIKPVGTK